MRSLFCKDLNRLYLLPYHFQIIHTWENIFYTDNTHSMNICSHKCLEVQNIRPVQPPSPLHKSSRF